MLLGTRRAAHARARLHSIVGRRAAPGPRPLEREKSMDRITGFDKRNRSKRAPTNGTRVVSRRVVRHYTPSNSRSSGTAALRLRLRPYDSVGKTSSFLPRQGAPLNMALRLIDMPIEFFDAPSETRVR